MSSPLPDVIRDFERVPANIVAQAAEFQPAILADVAGRRGALDGRIKALRPRMKLAGTAITVEVRPGDNLMIHAAIAMAKPGDVLVIDGKGDLSSALMGTIMMTACRQLGIAGVVMDGACRDSIEIDEMDYPVFSVGTNPNGPTKSIGILGYSPEEKVYTYYGVDNTNMTMASVPKGTVQGDTWTYNDEGTMGGQKFKTRVTIK